jgi:hypothetical protein
MENAVNKSEWLELEVHLALVNLASSQLRQALYTETGEDKPGGSQHF